MIGLDDEEQYFEVDPLKISPEHWQTIQEIAKVAMRDYKCEYAQAVVIAYFEWVELGTLIKTEH